MLLRISFTTEDMIARKDPQEILGVLELIRWRGERLIALISFLKLLPQQLIFLKKRPDLLSRLSIIHVIRIDHLKLGFCRKAIHKVIYQGLFLRLSFSIHFAEESCMVIFENLNGAFNSGIKFSASKNIIHF